MIVEGFVVVFLTLTQYGLCPSPPDASFVEYDFDNEVCILHLKDRLDYRQPILYTTSME